MTELVFQIEDDPDGGYTAKAVGASIFTEADTLEQLRDNIRDAVTCHFEKPEDRLKIIRLA
jgi:predicted RNase H-like HicB family nuclease